MKTIATLLFTFFVSVVCFSQQAQLRFHGSIGLAFANGDAANPVYVVIDNASDNAIVDEAPPSGPAILSESEYHIVKWNIGNSAGTYNVPFVSLTSGSPAYVAPSVTITAAGDAGGSLEFSTYGTDANNTVWPTGVNHLVHHPFTIPETVENNTINRFWIIDPDASTPYGALTKPSLSLAVNFDPAELDAIPDPDNLVIQRFNPNSTVPYPNGAWLDYMPGVAAVVNNPGIPLHFIQTGPIPGGEFYRAWAISSGNSPLPIELLTFKSECKGNGAVELSWTTATEVNNSHFTLERSEDGIIWETFADMIHGAGNSSSENDYAHIDNNPFRGLTYYRLSQTDFDGTSETFDPIVNDCDGVGFELISAIASENNNSIQLVVSAARDESFDIEVFDMNGKSALFSPNVRMTEGLNYFQVDKSDLGFGMYIIKLQSENELMTRKIFLN